LHSLEKRGHEVIRFHAVVLKLLDIDVTFIFRRR